MGKKIRLSEGQLRYIINRNVVTEGAIDKEYHFTDSGALASILSNDRFNFRYNNNICTTTW